MIIAVPFLSLIPDITLMIIFRVFYKSPADVHMLRMKNPGKWTYEIKDKTNPPQSIENIEEMPLNNSLNNSVINNSLSKSMSRDKSKKVKIYNP
jgi:hypothetical protein